MAPNLLEVPAEILERITEYIASLPDNATDTLTRIERRTPEVLSWRAVNRYVRDHVKYLQDNPTVGRDTPLGVRYVSDVVKLALGSDCDTILSGWDATVKQNTNRLTPGLTDVLPNELEAFKQTSHNMMTELHWTPPTHASLLPLNEHHTYYTTQGKMFEALCGSMGIDPDLLPHLKKIILKNRIASTNDAQSLRILANTVIPPRHWNRTKLNNRAGGMEMLQAAMMIGKSRPEVSVCSTMDMFVRRGKVLVDSFPGSLTIHAEGFEPEFKVTSRSPEGSRRPELITYYTVDSVSKIGKLESDWRDIMSATPLSVTAYFNIRVPDYLKEEAVDDGLEDAITTEIYAISDRLNSILGSSIMVKVDEDVPSCGLCGRTFFSLNNLA